MFLEHSPPHDNDYTRAVIYLRWGMENEVYDRVLGEIAHEMAHMVLGHALDFTDTAEFDACALAIRWGFRTQTLAIVEKKAREIRCKAVMEDIIMRQAAGEELRILLPGTPEFASREAEVEQVIMQQEEQRSDYWGDCIARIDELRAL